MKRVNAVRKEDIHGGDYNRNFLKRAYRRSVEYDCGYERGRQFNPLIIIGEDGLEGTLGRDVETKFRKIGTPWWVYDSISDLTPERIFWITGGLGSGKTTGAAMWFIDRWLYNNQSRFSWAVAPTYTKVEQILIPAVVQVLYEVYGFRERSHYSLTRTPFWKLILKNYSHELHFLSGDRPELFVGSNIATWWITEPGLQSREVYEKCQTRLRCPKALVRQGMAEGTPEGMNWYADVADIHGPGFDRVDDEKNHRRFIVETTMNKHLRPSPEVYAQTKIRDVYAYDPNKAISYEKGIFTKFTKGSAYWEFIDRRNIDYRLDYTPSSFFPLFLSFDFNVSPLAWVAIQNLNPLNAFQKIPGVDCKKTVVLAESSGESRGVMDAVAEFAAEFPPEKFGNINIHIHGDASGHAKNHHTAGSDYSLILNYLQSLGYNRVSVAAPKSNPRVQHRLEVAAAMMAYERLMVNPKCKKLINSFMKTSLKEGTFEIDKPRGEDWTHYADACTYAVFELAKDLNLPFKKYQGRPRGVSSL